MKGRAARKAKEARVGLLLETGGPIYARVNKTVMPTHAPPATTIPTADRSDRAHDVRDECGMLVPASRLNGEAVARKYPPCAMTAVVFARKAGKVTRLGPATFEAAFDALYEREARLASMGLEVGGGVRTAVVVQRALGELNARLGRRKTRDWLRGRV